MSRTRENPTSARTAVDELRAYLDERPVGWGVSAAGTFLGLITGVRMYLLPTSQWRLELAVVTALAGITVATGVVLVTSDVPVPHAHRAETLCLKGLGVMGLAALGLFLVGTPFYQSMATPLCLSDVLLTGGAVGGLSVGMLRPLRSERRTDGSDSEVGESGNPRKRRQPAETDRPRKTVQTVQLPVPPQETPESALDVWFELLGDPRCRNVLYYFTQSADEVATTDELGAFLEDSSGLQTPQSESAERTVESRATAPSSRITVTLHHVVLPKMDDAGVLDYDARTQTVRYREHPALEAWLEAVDADDLD